MTPLLEIEHVHKTFDAQPILSDVSLCVLPGEIVCLLGPSGSGKTTLLRIVSGLETADSGQVRFAGLDLNGVPVHTRGFGLVFQDLALFPHRDVLHNVTFGLRMQQVPPDESASRARDALALVGLTGFERRDVNRLSGGEQQRVALARALAPRPRLLMFDEPLGALDRLLREQLIAEMRAILKQVGITALYVTHDQAEALAIADRIAILHAGRIAQAGTPEELYRTPAGAFVARFLDLGAVVGADWLAAHGRDATPGTQFLIRPEHVRLVSASAPGALTGVVRHGQFAGGVYRLDVAVDGVLIRCVSVARIAEGQTVWLVPDAEPIKS